MDDDGKDIEGNIIMCEYGGYRDVAHARSILSIMGRWLLGYDIGRCNPAEHRSGCASAYSEHSSRAGMHKLYGIGDDDG